MSQNQAILFDMGGTLDGDGLHWLDHFETLYARAGIALPREIRRAAFDEAERRAAVDEEIAHARLADMIDRHVAWQFEFLGSGQPRNRIAVGSPRSGRVIVIRS